MSLRHEEPVFGLVVERLPATLQLAVAATVLSVLIGFPVGIASAIRRGGLIDLAAMGGALLAWLCVEQRSNLT